MVKETRTYIDFDGNERTEDFHFNLNPAEMYEMQYSQSGGLASLLEKISKENDQTKIVEFFKQLVLKAYGVKSLDGRVLLKDDQIRKEFECTMAYSEIFMDLATNAKKAAAFVNGIMPPKEVMDKYVERMRAAKEEKEKEGNTGEVVPINK